ncbi:MAG TPA: hypothetical protein VGZ47_21385, partial [Gemmataceae bacterium]|nr:hypothetical protein [Gemmataceae bacterium]
PVGEALPGLLTIKGMLAGQAFEKQIELEGVSRNAGYLPRTWGKLEIDRLLAEDSQKNKPAIIDLSKTLYVMSPFTSLLVLENEAMYKQYNIDRGRKDHWAIYPCPQKIEAPKPTVPNPEPKPTKSADDVLATIVWRNAPQVLVWAVGQPVGKININSAKGVDPRWLTWEGLNLENPDWGLEPNLPLNYYIERIEDSAVPGKVLPDELWGPPILSKIPYMNRLPASSVLGLTEFQADVVRAPIVIYNFAGTRDQLRIAATYTKEVQKFDRVKDLGNKRERGRPATVRGIPDMELAARSTVVNDLAGVPVFILTPSNTAMNYMKRAEGIDFEYARFPARRDVFMSDGSVRSVPYHYTANQGLGYWNANGPLNWDGDGMLMDGWMWYRSGPWGAPRPTNATASRPYIAALDEQKNVLGNRLMVRDGTSNTLMFADRLNGRISNGNYASFNPYMYLRPRPADQLWTDLDAETMPSGYYLEHRPQNFRPDPNFPLERELAARQMRGLSVITSADNTGEKFFVPTGQFYAVDDSVRIVLLSSGSVLGSDWTAPDDFRPPLDGSFPQSRLFYQRPAVLYPDHIFHDLVQYAPGMETSYADVQAVVEAELSSKAKTGHVDPQARALVERARAMGWRKLSLEPAAQARDSLARASGSYLCDGAGRFAIERTLASGLKEQVICDGQTLLHLYPEIGIGAKRSFSRFHFAELQSLIPWLLPAVDDLARDADVLAYGSNTVAIVPHGKAPARVEIHLVFDSDGRLQERRWVLMPHKFVLARQKFSDKSYGEPAAEPNLKPDLAKLVVLPLPYRTVKEVTEKQQRQMWWQRPFNDPLELAAARYTDPTAGPDGGWLIENVVKKGDTRPGWFTLIRAQNANVMPLAPKDGHEPVLKYLQNRSGNVGTLDSFLQRMMDLYDITDASHGLPPLVKPPEWAANVRGAIERNRNDLGAAALLLLAQRGGLAAGDWNLLADLWRQFYDIPGFWYTSRYERIRCLMAAGLEAQARQEFDKLYGDTLAAGVIPPLDSLAMQLPANAAGPVQQLLKNAAHERAAQHPEDVLALAWQTVWLGPQGTPQEIMAEFRPSTKWPEVTLSAVLLWHQLGQTAAAQEWLDELLGDPHLAKQPGLWRLAAELAIKRGQPFRQNECLEKALDLEFAHLPETVDVQQLREDYGTLLRGFGPIIRDHWQKDVPLPANLAGRIVKAADRWRSIDPEANDACFQAADLLSELNEPNLAWQYLTTVVALHPNEADPYRQMAQHLAERKDWFLAEKAYAAAFAAEPTDAQLLYDRALALEKQGRRAEEVALMTQIAEGTWQPRFDGVKAQARLWLIK